MIIPDSEFELDESLYYIGPKSHVLIPGRKYRVINMTILVSGVIELYVMIKLSRYTWAREDYFSREIPKELLIAWLKID